MPLTRINPELLRFARQATKQSFVPSQGAADPSAGGGGGPPPGAPPPPSPPGGDPSGGGGPPPMPPPPGGGGPPPMPGGGGDLMTALPHIIHSAVQSAVGQGGAGGASGGPGAMGKPAKPDLNTVAMDCFQTKKILMHICRLNGWEIPPDILDGPNRDPATGAPMPQGAPGSTSDPNAQGGGAQPPAPPPGAIPPIQPIQPAGPGGGIGGGMPHHHHHHHKMSATRNHQVEQIKTAAECLRLYAIVVENEQDPWRNVKAASDDQAIWGNPNGPGQEYPNRRGTLVNKAAAVAKMFQRRS